LGAKFWKSPTFLFPHGVSQKYIYMTKLRVYIDFMASDSFQGGNESNLKTVIVIFVCKGQEHGRITK
jgi:hypothetical protein